VPFGGRLGERGPVLEPVRVASLGPGPDELPLIVAVLLVERFQFGVHSEELLGLDLVALVARRSTHTFFRRRAHLVDHRRAAPPRRQIGPALQERQPLVPALAAFRRLPMLALERFQGRTELHVFRILPLPCRPGFLPLIVFVLPPGNKLLVAVDHLERAFEELPAKLLGEPRQIGFSIEEQPAFVAELARQLAPAVVFIPTPIKAGDGLQDRRCPLRS